MQMLMRANVVVPSAELGQLAAQIVRVGDGDAIQLLFEGAEEVFDPAALSLLRSPARTSLCGRSTARGDAARNPASPILPRAMQVGGLQAHPNQSQCATHQPRVEARLIVHADALRQAKASERDKQFRDDGDASLVGQRAQPQTGAAAVIEQAQHHTLAPFKSALPVKSSAQMRLRGIAVGTRRVARDADVLHHAPP